MPAYNQALLPPGFSQPYMHFLDRPMPHYVPEPGPTGVTLHMRYARWEVPLSLLIRLAGPKVLINGQEWPDVQWGTVHLPLPPGVYHVRVCCRGTAIAPLMGFAPMGDDYGDADAMIPVAPNHSTHAYYSAPVVATLRGGLEPGAFRRSPGFWFACPIWLAIMAFFLGVGCYAAVLAVTG